MIARLRGLLASKQAEQLVIDVGGVGYRVMAPLSTFYLLPEAGTEVELAIHTHVSDSALDLYGFLSEREKSLFKLLLGVSGIGPRLALNVLSGIEAPDLVRALASGDQFRITAVPGVGKKTAQRMIVELKDKVTALHWAAEAVGRAPEQGEGPAADAVSALTNLGYPQAQAERAVKAAQAGPKAGAGLEELLKESLKILAR